MPDSLRTRIAAAIMRRWEYEPCCTCQDCSLEVADAVIRELGMVREYSIGDDEGGRVLWFDDEEPVAPREGEAVEVRYITEWTPDG